MVRSRLTYFSRIPRRMPTEISPLKNCLLSISTRSHKHIDIDLTKHPLLRYDHCWAGASKGRGQTRPSFQLHRRATAAATAASAATPRPAETAAAMATKSAAAAAAATAAAKVRRCTLLGSVAEAASNLTARRADVHDRRLIQGDRSRGAWHGRRRGWRAATSRRLVR